MSEFIVLAIVIIALFVMVGRGNLLARFAHVVLNVAMYRMARLILRSIIRTR